MKGIYLCRDRQSGRVLPFDPNQPDPEFSLTERLAGAVEQPEHSLIWWAEAIRVNRTPDAEAVRAMAAALVPCSLAGTRAEVGRAACTIGQHDVGRRPGKAAALLWRAAVTWGKETPALARELRENWHAS